MAELQNVGNIIFFIVLVLSFVLTSVNLGDSSINKGLPIIGLFVNIFALVFVLMMKFTPNCLSELMIRPTFFPYVMMGLFIAVYVFSLIVSISDINDNGKENKVLSWIVLISDILVVLVILGMFLTGKLSLD
jgi:hypothetical protein